ncbi:MAG TPA: hypothetical protein EYG38_11970 [Verrucomicrobia bacterium]|nr:hypothetical protein [Verrucomicrobiota bacterium]
MGFSEIDCSSSILVPKKGQWLDGAFREKYQDYLKKSENEHSRMNNLRLMSVTAVFDFLSESLPDGKSLMTVEQAAGGLQFQVFGPEGGKISEKLETDIAPDKKTDLIELKHLLSDYPEGIEFSLKKGYDLSVMSVPETADLTDKRPSLIIVALVADSLHIRIFDARGEMVIDKPEDELISGKELTDIKNNKDLFLTSGTPRLKNKKRQTIIKNAKSIAGYSPEKDEVPVTLETIIKHTPLHQEDYSTYLLNEFSLPLQLDVRSRNRSFNKWKEFCFVAVFRYDNRPAVPRKQRYEYALVKEHTPLDSLPKELRQSPAMLAALRADNSEIQQSIKTLEERIESIAIEGEINADKKFDDFKNHVTNDGKKTRTNFGCVRTQLTNLDKQSAPLKRLARKLEDNERKRFRGEAEQRGNRTRNRNRHIEKDIKQLAKTVLASKNSTIHGRTKILKEIDDEELAKELIQSILNGGRTDKMAEWLRLADKRESMRKTFNRWLKEIEAILGSALDQVRSLESDPDAADSEDKVKPDLPDDLIAANAYESQIEKL